MVLGYLISPVVQIVDNHGKPIVGAKIYVYKAGTTNTVNTYRDFSNHYNPTPVLTNTLGNCTIIAPDDMVYDIVVKDNRNNLLMSKNNLTVSSGINPDINLRFREGYGIIIRKNGNTVTIAVDTDIIATKDDLATKQDKLTAGDNIEITNDNTVNVVNRKTLYTQWPLKVDRGSSMVKLYLDQDFVDNNTDILPGADLTTYNDASGRQVIGVDTTSTATGDYNFYAGYNNTINGNYNAVFGYVGSVNGDGNFIAGQSDNSISGYGNAVFGTRNTITNNGTYNLIHGSQNNVNHGSNNLVVGSMNETNGHGCIIGGGSNSLYCDGGYFANNLQLGDSNIVSADYVNANLLFGDDNTISGNNYRYNIIGGNENTFDCSYGLYNTLVLGYHQTFSGNNIFERNIIAGDGNTFGNGLSNSLVIGTDNNAYSNNVAIIGDGHNVSAEFNARLGKFSTNGDYWFAIGNGTDDAHRSNVFEVRKNNDIYFEYNNQMVQLQPASFSAPAIVYTSPTLSLESRNYQNENVYTTTEIPANTLFDGSITINHYIASSILTYVGIGTTIENVSTNSYIDDMCDYPMTMNGTGDGKMLTITIPIIFKNDSNVARKIGIRINGSVTQQTLQLIIKGVTFSI